MQKREREREDAAAPFCFSKLKILSPQSIKYSILLASAGRSNVPEIEISLAVLCHSEIDNYVYACPGTHIMICPGGDANGDSPPVGYCCRQQAVLTHDEGGRVAEEETGGVPGVSEGNEGAA